MRFYFTALLLLIAAVAVQAQDVDSSSVDEAPAQDVPLDIDQTEPSDVPGVDQTTPPTALSKRSRDLLDRVNKLRGVDRK